MAGKTEFMNYAYFDKNIVEFEKATVSIATHSLQYGTTCFGGLRGYYRNGKVVIFRLRDHYERLMAASKMLGFEFFIGWDEFYNIVSELVKKNDIKEDFYIRPFVYCPTPRIAPKKPGLDFELAIYMLPMADPTVAMAYGTKYVNIPGIFKAGFPLVVIGIIVTIIVLLAVLNFAPWLITV